MANFPQGVPQLPARCSHTDEEEWRLLYVATTLATHRLVLAGCGNSVVVGRVEMALGVRSPGNLEA